MFVYERWPALTAPLFLLATLSSCSGGETTNDVDVGSGVDAAVTTDAASGDSGPSRVGVDVGDTADRGPEYDYSVPPGCNGAEEFCGRRIDEFTFATTHNANNNLEQGFVLANQSYSMKRQLQDGVRALMIDVWDDGGVTAMCHSSCGLGSRPLVDGLRDIDAFLQKHPSEVVVILFESKVGADRIEQAFEEAALLERVATLSREQPLPTLGELSDEGTPWIVFTQDGGGDPGWYHPMWQFLWDTDYSAESVTDFSCDSLRGDIENPLFLVNHFLTNPVGSKPLATRANELEFLRDRVLGCWSDSGQRPSFVAVDFYEIGGLMTVVNELNMLDSPP